MHAWLQSIGMGTALVMLTASGAAATFDPANYAGTWSGTWKNSTFKVDGTFGGVVTASDDGQTMTVAYQFSGLFNCGSVDATRTLTRGVDFTDAGLNFAATNTADWGTTTVASKSTKKVEKVAMSGTPSCRPDISGYTVKAKLKGTTLKGKMTVTFAQGTPKKGKTSFKATKQ